MHFFRYQKPSLEDVFLELCVRDGDLEDIKNRKERSKRPNIFKVSQKEMAYFNMGEKTFISIFFVALSFD